LTFDHGICIGTVNDNDIGTLQLNAADVLLLQRLLEVAELGHSKLNPHDARATIS
jgi:hypothetical protein